MACWAAGESVQPLAADRGQHADLAILRMQGTGYRQLCRVYASAGLRLELPYFDDRIIETALAVRTHERRTPWRYKPLPAEAMRPVLPEAIANRTTKGEFSADLRTGLRRHLPEILDLFADSALAIHGLINPDLLPVRCWHPNPSGPRYSPGRCRAVPRGRRSGVSRLGDTPDLHQLGTITTGTR